MDKKKPIDFNLLHGTLLDAKRDGGIIVEPIKGPGGLHAVTFVIDNPVPLERAAQMQAIHTVLSEAAGISLNAVVIQHVGHRTKYVYETSYQAPVLADADKHILDKIKTLADAASRSSSESRIMDGMMKSADKRADDINAGKIRGFSSSLGR